MGSTDASITTEDMGVVAVVSRSTTSMWPPWPLNLLQQRSRNEEGRQGSSDKSLTTSTNDDSSNNDFPITAANMYPSMGALMWAYLRQRTRIWVRQLEEIGSQVWFNLPPATPPLILLASIPSKVVSEDPATGQQVINRIFPVISNPFARTMVAFGLGMAVLSWSQQELKRKRTLTPLQLTMPYESVSRVFLPPLLPEEVPDLEIEALEEVEDKKAEEFEFGDETYSNKMLSGLSPRIRKHLNGLYETATLPKKNLQYYFKQWKRGRENRKREVAKIRRLSIYDELVALQVLKRRKSHQSKSTSRQDSDCPKGGYALVTGASQGIGRAIAVELARWEIPLVLVARDVNKLVSLAFDLEKCYGVKCCVLGADLSQLDAAERIYEATTKAGITIDVLVNNAGIAFEGLAVDMDTSDLERMVILNSVTYAKLSQLYGQDMKQNRRGRILMVSSMAGLCNASPNTAVYGATKAFGKSLSLSMAKEMEPFGVGVTCLLPGAVKETKFRSRSGTRRALCWSMPFYPRSPESVAHQGVVALLDGDSQTIPGWQNRIFATIIRPIIPQRFEIMCVQAAFSPLCLPWVFRRRNGRVVEEEHAEKVSTRTSSLKARPECDSPPFLTPLLQQRSKIEPLPRILMLLEKTTEEATIVDSEANKERIEVDCEEEILPRTSGDNDTSIPLPEVTKESTSDGEQITGLGDTDTSNDHAESDEAETTVLENPTEAFLETDCKAVAHDVEVEDDGVNVKQNDNETIKRNSDVIESIAPLIDSGKAVDGKRSETRPTPNSYEDDEDFPFSPRLGPIDIMEHRQLKFPKQSATEKTAIIIV
jgi:hypothetical protein